jgi:mannose-6-phosphate isomerase-like protein (cupin superfamily)
MDALIAADGRHTQTLLDGKVGARSCIISCAKTPPGSGSPAGLHRHRVDQLFYILQGIMTVEVSGETFRAGPGTLVVFPAGTPHRHSNDGAEDTLHLSIVAPPPDPELPFALR